MTVYDFACFVQNIRLLLFVKKEWLFPSKVLLMEQRMCRAGVGVFIGKR